MKHPWMPLWVGDFLTDIEHLTPAETGAYFRLVLFYWANGGLPKTESGTCCERAIARIARLDSKTWRNSRPALRALFKGPGTWCHIRIEHELAKAIEKSRVNSAKAMLRHSRGNATAVQSHSHIKKERNGIRQERQQAKSSITGGFSAYPNSEEFKKWKAWAFERNIPLWRELQKREIENRSFDFETQWPN
jgi:uncharacterized protein YdaU (DUF1376 family)